MRHLDLFSGIGGFALAAQWVWGKDHEIISFCEIDKFCQKVLKKHWPDVPICEDIKELTNEWITANTVCNGRYGKQAEVRREHTEGVDSEEARKDTMVNNSGCCSTRKQIDLLTGGFPCQPFSVAGQRRGTDDDRYLWPEMLRVIRETKPRWVIGENVAGFVNMALDEVCASLEMEGYEVQPVIIPACAVNAPHRRDRVWIVANSRRECGQGRENAGDASQQIRCEENAVESERTDKDVRYWNDTDTNKERLQRRQENGNTGIVWREREQLSIGQNPEWDKNWLEVATEFCRVDARVSNRVDRLKSLGNAIVPQVAQVIMQSIKSITE